MDNKTIKVRVNLNQREFEVEGEQGIIFENFGNMLKDYLDIIKTQPTHKVEQLKKYNNSPIIEESSASERGQSLGIPDSFGEFYNRFPKSLSNVDKLLAACYYIQSISEQKQFTVKEANDMLLEQGVKLSNSNAFNKANSDTKRVFKLSGKFYRVSDLGVDSIKSLMING